MKGTLELQPFDIKLRAGPAFPPIGECDRCHDSPVRRIPIRNKAGQAVAYVCVVCGLAFMVGNWSIDDLTAGRRVAKNKLQVPA